MYLVFTLPSIFSSSDKIFEWIKRIGEYIIKEVTITVGGKELDKQQQDDKAEIAELKTKVASLETELASIKAHLGL